MEEAQEVATARSIEELTGEVADLQEVLEALMQHTKIQQVDVDKCKAKKLAERGGFGKIVYFNNVTVPEDSRDSEYLSSQPDVYPEITEELLCGGGKCDTLVGKVLELHEEKLRGACSSVARFIDGIEIAPETLSTISSAPQLLVTVNDLILFDRALPDLIELGYKPIGENGVPNRRLFRFIDEKFAADVHCFAK